MLSQQVRLGVGRRTAPSTPPRGIAPAQRSVRVASAAERRSWATVEWALMLLAKGTAEANNDPNYVNMMKERMKDPEMQEFMAKVQAKVYSPEVMQHIPMLMNDPEMKEYLKEIRRDGLKVLPKYDNDPAWHAKMAKRLGEEV